jgi:hypothetical protein
MRALLLISLLASCAPRTIEVLEPLPRTTPSPGYPLHTIIPYWHRNAVLCVVDGELPLPVYDNGKWHCPPSVHP